MFAKWMFNKDISQPVFRLVLDLPRVLLACVLCMTSLAVFSEQSHNASKTINVWAYSLFTPEVTNYIVKPFFDELASRTGDHYHIKGDTRVTALMRSCQQQQPDVIIVSQSVGNDVQSLCGYQVIAVSLQNIQLFRKKTSDEGEGIETPLRRVGLLLNTKASQIAFDEIPDKYGEVTYTVYNDIFQMVKQYRRDRLDAIALPELFINAAPNFASNWTPHYQFKQQGVGVVMVSPLLEKSLVDSLQAAFLNDTELTRRIWQKKVGLGKFLHPDAVQLTGEKSPQ